MSKALPEELDVRGIIEADSGLRIEFQRGMRAPIVDGQPTLKPCFRADCYVKPNTRWVHLVTLVDDTVDGLFHQFTMLSREGAVRINR